MLVSTRVPPLLTGLVDDAALLPPLTAAFAEAVDGHRGHLETWYADLLGPLLLPTSRMGDLIGLATPATCGPLAVSLVGDAGPAPGGLAGVIAAVEACAAAGGDRFRVRGVEVPVAMRGEDPMPGLRALLDQERSLRGIQEPVACYAEVPLTWGVMVSLETLAEARAQGARIAAKFRVGGLAEELFPTPVELAAVICACRDRDLPFTLAGGHSRAVRRTDPETGLVNHGFLNVLAAVLVACSNGEASDLAELLASTDVPAVLDVVTPRLATPRPLWRGLNARGGISGFLRDLCALGLLEPPSWAEVSV
ncbi:MAG: hypothetical protein JXA67_03630 [Micromonosporaceae bacterium]|nr:hypothetical protein [Micromonosporaceae bacterium]